MRKTIVIGASEKKERYSNKCVRLLRNHNIQTVAIGKKEGKIKDVKIQTGHPSEDKVDTVAIYLAPKNQKEYYQYVIDLKPERIIFPPGAENPDFYPQATAHGIETSEACPLVMLKTGIY